MTTNKRSRAREAAVQLLFGRDLHPAAAREDIARYLREELREPELIDLALSLYDGTVAHLADIDAGLSRAAENWNLSRMAVIDRNVLRLGAYELAHCPETPPAVVFNEAIELARRYGSADSPGFVNGVLDRYQRDRQKALTVELSRPEAVSREGEARGREGEARGREGEAPAEPGRSSSSGGDGPASAIPPARQEPRPPDLAPRPPDLAPRPPDLAPRPPDVPRASSDARGNEGSDAAPPAEAP